MFSSSCAASPSPTSPTQRRPVVASNDIRQGFLSPHAQISSRGAPVTVGEGATAQLIPQAVTAGWPRSGFSGGIVPSRLTRRIFPLPLVRQLADQLGLPESHAPSPAPMYSTPSGPIASAPPTFAFPRRLRTSTSSESTSRTPPLRSVKRLTRWRSRSLPPAASDADQRKYKKPFAANAGSTSTPRSPFSPPLSTGRVPASVRDPFEFRMRTAPFFSTITARPSGRKRKSVTSPSGLAIQSTGGKKS